MSPGKIPIGDAREIARKRQIPLVVIFGIEEGGASFHVTTYGMTKKLCRLAANFGEQFAQAIFDGTIAPPLEEPLHMPDSPLSTTGGHRTPRGATP